MRVNKPEVGSNANIAEAGGSRTLERTRNRGANRGGRTFHIDSGVSDNVDISGRAKYAARARDLARSASDISSANEAKINRLKSAIKNGTYHFDPEKVADRLVDEHLGHTFR